MSLSSIIGQPLAVELASRWLAKMTTNPLLLYGPEGVGKKTLALALAKELECTGAPERRGVGADNTCNSCRKINEGLHPDVRVLDLTYQAEVRKEPIEKQLTLRIETVLEERRRLFQSAVEGAWKVLILDDAHKLTVDAANVLLKTLEEPPPQTAIFLLTPFRDRLLTTIVSRCQPIRFRPLNNEEMTQVLKNTIRLETGSDPSRLIELALGSPGRALHMSREDEVHAAQEAENVWEGMAQLTPAQILTKAEGRGKAAKTARPEIEQKLKHLLLPAMRALRQGDASAAKSVRHIEQALTRLRQNVQPALVYENLLLQLSQESQ